VLESVLNFYGKGKNIIFQTRIKNIQYISEEYQM